MSRLLGDLAYGNLVQVAEAGGSGDFVERADE
jgi:hypothetical protein